MGSAEPVDISTVLCGKRIRSPFGYASVNQEKLYYPNGPLEEYVDFFATLVDAGAGFVTMPSATTLVPETEAIKTLAGSAPARTDGREGRYWRHSPEGFMWSGPPAINMNINLGVKLLKAVRRVIPSDVALIGGALEGADPQTWVEGAKRLEDAGADMIELNLGCPLEAEAVTGLPPEAMERLKMGASVGVEPSIAGPVISALTNAVKVPIIAKITPEAGYPGILVMAKTAMEAGARAVIATHTVMAVQPPDIYNGGKGRWPGVDPETNPVNIATGPWLKYLGQRALTFFKQRFPDLDVIGGAGYSKPEDIVESIMLGANAVETCTGVAMKGYRIFSQTNGFLKRYMERQGYKKLDDFRGLGLKYVVGFNQTKFLDYVSDFDPSLCSGCRVCVDTNCPATYFDNGVANNNKDQCMGCAQCVSVCPENAISLIPRPS
ncbi:MAG: 4Fe-4S binding protein [Chloroflexi bacterium]|nr:4Fe-4S binding protein [Chloroflexota bacterium]